MSRVPERDVFQEFRFQPLDFCYKLGSVGTQILHFPVASQVQCYTCKIMTIHGTLIYLVLTKHIRLSNDDFSIRFIGWFLYGVVVVIS